MNKKLGRLIKLILIIQKEFENKIPLIRSFSSFFEITIIKIEYILGSIINEISKMNLWFIKLFKPFNNVIVQLKIFVYWKITFFSTRTLLKIRAWKWVCASYSRESFNLLTRNSVAFNGWTVGEHLQTLKAAKTFSSCGNTHERTFSEFRRRIKSHSCFFVRV